MCLQIHTHRHVCNNIFKSSCLFHFFFFFFKAAYPPFLPLPSLLSLSHVCVSTLRAHTRPHTHSQTQSLKAFRCLLSMRVVCNTPPRALPPLSLTHHTATHTHTHSSTKNKKPIPFKTTRMIACSHI
jgi:hypothetical protein